MARQHSPLAVLSGGVIALSLLIPGLMLLYKGTVTAVHAPSYIIATLLSAFLSAVFVRRWLRIPSVADDLPYRGRDGRELRTRRLFGTAIVVFGLYFVAVYGFIRILAPHLPSSHWSARATVLDVRPVATIRGYCRAEATFGVTGGGTVKICEQLTLGGAVRQDDSLKRNTVVLLDLATNPFVSFVEAIHHVSAGA